MPEISVDSLEKKLWGRYCYGLSHNTPETCNTERLYLVWCYCPKCKAESSPMLLCAECYGLMQQVCSFSCLDSCGYCGKEFLMTVVNTSAEFVEAARKSRAWAEYVPRKERRKEDRKALVKKRGGGKHRG